jgi:hypothetical protein
MEDLTKKLREAGWDYLGGATREQRLLQVWKKRMGDEIQLEFSSIQDAFENNAISLPINKTDALNITSNASKKYDFLAGVDILDDLLEKSNLGKLKIGTKISYGKTINISYEGAFTENIDLGKLNQYFSEAKLLFNNKPFLKDLNRDNFIIITSVLYANNLRAVIETKANNSTELDTVITGIVGGEIKINKDSDSKLTITAPTGRALPIALKYHKIKYDDGVFDDTVQVSDSKDYFE